jgi:hypothetical protein
VRRWLVGDERGALLRLLLLHHQVADFELVEDKLGDASVHRDAVGESSKSTSDGLPHRLHRRNLDLPRVGVLLWKWDFKITP